ncbi:hypothetical protein JBE04_37625 [Streptomyces sp. PRKS01-29]|nr:hypothetical protein [Streptomyces sabulosicollis]MBI0300029.1 hypothetical protein [Streptomyces sabulosicollis]
MTEKRRRRKQTSQIFVNASGGRRQLLALAALAVGCACLGYLLLLVAALSGVLWQDDQEPPRTAERSTTGSAPTAGPWSTGTAPTARPWSRADSRAAGVTAPLAAASSIGGGPW